MGRTAIKIDWETVDKLCVAGCKGTEIAGYLGMSNICFYERCVVDNGVKFTEYRQQRLSKGNASIRAKQYNIAMEGKGDKDMLKWLGKNRLGQSEKNDVNTTSTNLNLDYDPTKMTMEQLIDERNKIIKSDPYAKTNSADDSTED